MLVRIPVFRFACVALVMLNLMGRWCDVACCSPGTACADGCSTEGMCCDEPASDIDIAPIDSERGLPGSDGEIDHSKSACSAVCCAKVVVVEVMPLLHRDTTVRRWLPSVADIAPELLSTSGIFHPPRA